MFSVQSLNKTHPLVNLSALLVSSCLCRRRDKFAFVYFLIGGDDLNDKQMLFSYLLCTQLTEEKLGTSEKTELDAHFENLSERAESTKVWTEKILRNTEAVLTPNPGNRAEDFIFEKIEKKKPTRLSNIEYMGLDMIEVVFIFFYLSAIN